MNLNGDFSQWTLGSEFTACPHAQIVADGHRHCNTTTAIHTVRKSSDVPTLQECGRIIHSSLEIEVTTAASPGANENTGLVYRGEGSEWAAVHGHSTAIRCWVKTTVPGVYHFGLANGAENLYCPMPVEIGVPDVWTLVERALPAAPGEWWTDHRIGYSLFFFLASGTNFHSSVGEWFSGAKCGGSNQVNFNSTIGNKIKLTGFRVRRADDERADEFEAPEVTERSCMRYLQKSFQRGVKPASGLGWGNGELTWPTIATGAGKMHMASVRLSVPLRKDDYTITGYNVGSTGAQARTLTHGDCTGTTFDEKTAYGFRVYATNPMTAALNESVGIHWVVDASLPAPGGGPG